MRCSILGAPCDALTLRETVERVEDVVLRRGRLQQASLNVAKLVKMRSDQLLREDVSGSDLISADGMGIVLAARVMGTQITERVAGVDLMDAVLELCARRNFKPYFLGARPEIVAKAVEVATLKHPGLEFAGWRDGYFKSADEEEICRAINASGADCLFIGIPTPAKERFMKKWKDRLDVPFVMGVGGSLDVLSGMTSRAPIWMQRRGLEWLHRVIQEPRRMWWRYASTNTVFLWLLIRALVTSRLRQTANAT